MRMVSASELVPRKGILPSLVTVLPDEHGDEHGDDHPDGGDAAGGLELGVILNGHEPQQDMGHTEVAQAPGQGGDDAQGREAARLVGGHVVALGQVQVAGHGGGVGRHGLPATGLADAEEDDEHQGKGHDDALDQVRGRHGQEAAQDRVADDDDGTHDHGHVVVHPKEAVEQRTDGLKAGGSVGDEEDQDDHSGDAGEHILLVPVAPGEEAGDGDGPDVGRVPAQTLGHDEPVEVGADGQANGRPAHLGNAAEIGQAGQTHEQVAAHVRGFGAHGCDHRA